jgi:hypothetical protein
MTKKLLILFSIFSFGIAARAQSNMNAMKLLTNHPYPDFNIAEGAEANFTFQLKKDIYYTIVAEQKGIDVVIILKDKTGKKITEQDSPNGRFGPEKISFSPDSTENYILTVKPLAEEANSKKGAFSVSVKAADKDLQPLSYKALTEDFDVLANALKETRVGLWYNTYAQFDSTFAQQRNKIKDRMNALDFYRIVAPLLAFTGEGHANIRRSEDTKAHFAGYGKFLPFIVKIIAGDVYILNDVNGFKTKGMKISKINGTAIDTIMKQFLSIEPADGYNITSKYHWLEGAAFARHYASFFEVSPKHFNVELTDLKSNKKIIYTNIPSYNYKLTDSLSRKYAADNPSYLFKESATFKIDSAAHTAILTVNTFNTDRFKGGRKGFQQFLKNSFGEIAQKNIQHLIIDVRKNEGGAQGMEDHLLSYLITGNYAKYKYVEIPGFTFSFSQYTDIKEKEAREDFEKDLKEYFYRADDGRYTDIPGMYKGDSAQENNFKGDLYILISGLTFSGGSEFAALAKNYTAAKFIGEETGGGYYGNTSGNFLQFTLPNSKLTGRIPVCKFVIVPKDFGIPFGHGVMPDFPVQQNITEYFSGYDPEMNLAKEMIQKK